MSNALTRDAIIQEAINLLREEGLDQFSLRKVAARLHVKAPSLYWHVSDKADLLALVAEFIFRNCLAAMRPCRSWREWLMEFGTQLWAAQNSTRDLGRLMLVATYPEERLDAMSGDINRGLLSFGLDVSAANSMQSSVQAFVTGWANLALGPNGEYLQKKMPVEVIFRAGLRSLIVGFSADVHSDGVALANN